MKQTTTCDGKDSSNPSMQLQRNTSIEFIEHLANCFFNEMIRTVSQESCVIFLCGNGYKGACGYALATLFVEHNIKTFVVEVQSNRPVEYATQVWQKRCKNMHLTLLEIPSDATMVVDALLDVEEDSCEESMWETLSYVNECTLQKVCIFGPSVCCIKDEFYVFKAKITYVLKCPDISIFMYPRKGCCGQLVYIHAYDWKASMILNQTKYELICKQNMSRLLPKRSSHSHKGTYGKVLLVGGSIGMSGAVSLSGLSVLRSGAGSLTLAIPKSIHTILAINLWESMQILLPSSDGYINQEARTVIEENIDNYSCVLFGCGIGRSEGAKLLLKFLWHHTIPLVVDADGLFYLSHYLCDRDHVILTPHLKEFARIVDVDVTILEKNILLYALDFSKKYPNIVLVLKSETTMVVYKEYIYLNTYGNTGLAKAGSGDVLSGIICSLYAQNKDALKAAILGVFIHSYNANVLSEKLSVYSMLPHDIINQIGITLLELENLK